MTDLQHSVNTAVELAISALLLYVFYLIVKELWPRVMATEFGRQVVGQTILMLQIVGVVAVILVIAIFMLGGNRMERLRDPDWFTLLKWALVLIVAVPVITVLLYLQGSISRELATFMLTALAPFGTVLLALATFETIQQNQRSLKELEKDRKRAVKTDILREIVQPAIDVQKENIESLGSGDIGWKDRSGVRLDNLAIPEPTDHERAIVRIFKDEYPEVDEQLMRYQVQLQNFMAAADELGEEIKSLVETKRKDGELGVESSVLADDFQADIIAQYLVNEKTPEDIAGGLTKEEYATFWENHRGEFLSLIEDDLGEELSDHRARRENVLEHSTKVMGDLRELKGDILLEYGISESDFS